MRFWWVNHKQTFRHEVEGGYVWCPKTKSNGTRNHFYETLREVRQGDLVFSYADAHLQAAGLAKRSCYSCPKPDEFGSVGDVWGDAGWRVDVGFVKFSKPLRIKTVIGRIAGLLPARYSPIQANGHGNQGAYLAEISRPLAEVLIDLAEPMLRRLVTSRLADEEDDVDSDFEPPALAAWEDQIQGRIESDIQIPETTRVALVKARKGQGVFRREIHRLEHQCRVTHVTNSLHLIASHIKPWREEFFKEYKEIEMLYEIISPDAFLRPFIDDYGTLGAIYEVVRKACTKRVQVDREFQRKTNKLVQEKISTYGIEEPGEVVKINEDTVKYLVEKKQGEATKVTNLVKSIEKSAEEQSDDPFLVAMAERARAVQEKFESRQSTTADALEELLAEVERNEARKKEQAERGFDGLPFFVFEKLEEAGVGDAEAVSRKIREAFGEFSNWKSSENALGELRKKVTFAIFAESEDLDEVTRLVEELFRVLERGGR